MKKYGEAIPTKYHGTEFRSRLEANVAAILDLFKITWEYEAKSFLLPSGHYMPDFYIPQDNVFIEAKGIVTELSETLAMELSESEKTTIIMVGKNSTIYKNGKKVEKTLDYDLNFEGKFMIFGCIKCMKFSLEQHHCQHDLPFNFSLWDLNFSSNREIQQAISNIKIIQMNEVQTCH